MKVLQTVSRACSISRSPVAWAGYETKLPLPDCVSYADSSNQLWMGRRHERAHPHKDVWSGCLHDRAAAVGAPRLVVRLEGVRLAGLVLAGGHGLRASTVALDLDLLARGTGVHGRGRHVVVVGGVCFD